MPGGGSISRLALARDFAAAGRDVVGLSPKTPAAPADSRWDNPRLVYYDVEGFLSSYPPPAGPRLRRFHDEVAILTTAVTKWIQDFQPDVIVAGREDIALTVIELAATAAKPAVTMVRGAPSSHLLRGAYESPWKERLSEALARSDAIVTVAEFLTQGLRRLGFENVTTAPNAPQSELFRPSAPDKELLDRLGIPQDWPIVLYSGRVAVNKRPLDLIEGLRLARERGFPATLVFCGDGPLEADCRAAADAAGVPLHLTGWLPQEKVARLLCSADVVALASNAEGAPRTLLEAMACERCVLSSDIPSARELICEGETGLLFRLGDPRDFADKLVYALSDADLRAKLGAAALGSVAWRKPELAVRAHLDAFDGALHRHASRRS